MTPLRPDPVHRAPLTTSRYRRPSRLRRAGVFALGAGGIVAIACGGGGGTTTEPGMSASDWVQTDGAAGRINLDDVQQAYRDAFNAEGGFEVRKFEEAVNKIYEGDNLVMIEVAQNDGTVDISGWEDLNGNKRLDRDADDKLFTITQELKDNGATTVQGHGANSYYYHSSPFGGFGTGLFLGYLAGNIFSGGGRYYATPPVVYDQVGTSRASYRSSADYARQKDRNLAYGSSVSNPNRFGAAVTNQPISPARQSYQTRQVNSGGFRSSSSTTRSIGSGGRTGGSTSSGGRSGGAAPSGGSGSSGGSGGISGGGGLMVL